MGSCYGRIGRGDNIDGNTTRTNSATRKNQSLCFEPIKWKSDVPLTEGQLRSKRDEFWETAPAFEGRKEIWDALRAAAAACEASDIQHAQAIIDGAGISVPNGYLMECYDELGTRYQVPIYCLSYPINIIQEGSYDRDSPPESSTGSTADEGGNDITLKIRISYCPKDLKMKFNTKDSIAVAKGKLKARRGIEAYKQRWFFGGKLLSDRTRLEETKIQNGYVVQVVVND